VLGLGADELKQIIYLKSYIVLNSGKSSMFYKHQILNNVDQTTFEHDFPDVKISTGAQAIKQLLKQMDIKNEVSLLRNALGGMNNKSKKAYLFKRIKILDQLIASKANPS
jgi:DNA-directed RNA polymerase subunit beta'